MTESQPTLFDAQPLKDGVEAQASWLEKLLLQAKCWMTARDIQLTNMGGVIDREIRQIASESANIISGQKGYKHIAHATAEEVNHAANWLESQAKKMSERACAIRRNAHRTLG